MRERGARARVIAPEAFFDEEDAALHVARLVGRVGALADAERRLAFVARARRARRCRGRVAARATLAVAFSGAHGALGARALRLWSAAWAPALARAPPAALAARRRRRRRARRLRVGFVSAWWCNSAIGRVLGGVVRKLDRAEFVVVLARRRRRPGRRAATRSPTRSPAPTRRGAGPRRGGPLALSLSAARSRRARGRCSSSRRSPSGVGAARAQLAAARLDVLVFGDVGMEGRASSSRTPAPLPRVKRSSPRALAPRPPIPRPF